MRIFFLLIFIIMKFAAIAQNTIGLPEVINYNKQLYKAGSQNWDIKQGDNGLIYFGNNEGLLSFDGTFWKLYPLPNKTIVRSIEITPDHKIYVGGQNEFGYFYPDPKGALQYHSLTKLVPVSDRTFDDVWTICNFNGTLFFRTNRKLFRLEDNKLTVYTTKSEWRFIAVSNDQLLAEDLDNGALLYDNGLWVPLQENSVLSQSALITSFIPLDKSRSLITTLQQGFFIYENGNKLTRIQSPEVDKLSGLRAYKAIRVDDDNIAIATSMGGCYIMDFNGGAHLVQSLTITEGLQNNNIRSILQDKDKNLWLGLENGIDFVEYDNAIKHIYPESQNFGSGYTSLVYKDYLYMGTSNGLYRVKTDDQNNLSFVTNKIEKVQNTDGEVWNLSIVNGQLLMAHHTGAYIIRGNKAEILDNKTGFWTFRSLPSSHQMIAGNYLGLSFYNFGQNNFTPKGPDLQFASARFVVVENDHTFWVAHPYKGIYKISIDDSGHSDIKLFTNKSGLPSVNNNYIFKIKDKIIISSENGLYEYNKEKDSFLLSPFLSHNLVADNIRYLKEDNEGNIYYAHQKEISVLDLSGKTPRIINFPELKNKLVNGFENVSTLDKNNILIGSEKGFYHVDYEKYKQSNKSIILQIRDVQTFGYKDSILYSGYGSPSKPELSYRMNSIHIEFSAILFGQQSNIEYSYLLKGFEKSWSAWSLKPEKDYTNLPPGAYEFIVKARTNLGNESSEISYHFTILPPWYQSVPARIIYFILILGMLFLFRRYQQKKFVRQRLKYEEKQKQLKYLHHLELEKNEKEIVKLKNEKLETEIENKNFELANSAMHLVQKKEMMDKLQNDLNSMLTNIDNEDTFKKCKKLLKILNEDNKLDDSWDNFEMHFDKIHTDFLVMMKQKYPALTAGELKLCAYVRLNLATKEIARLLNISTRGVETTRYRLRKKLELTKDDNLFEFLLEQQFEQG